MDEDSAATKSLFCGMPRSSGLEVPRNLLLPMRHLIIMQDDILSPKIA